MFSDYRISFFTIECVLLLWKAAVEKEKKTAAAEKAAGVSLFLNLEP